MDELSKKTPNATLDNANATDRFVDCALNSDANFVVSSKRERQCLLTKKTIRQ